MRFIYDTACFGFITIVSTSIRENSVVFVYTIIGRALVFLLLVFIPTFRFTCTDYLVTHILWHPRVNAKIFRHITLSITVCLRAVVAFSLLNNTRGQQQHKASDHEKLHLHKCWERKCTKR